MAPRSVARGLHVLPKRASAREKMKIQFETVVWLSILASCGRGGIHTLEPIGAGCMIDGGFIAAFNLDAGGFALDAPCAPVCKPELSTTSLIPLALGEPCGKNLACYWDPT